MNPPFLRAPSSTSFSILPSPTNPNPNPNFVNSHFCSQGLPSSIPNINNANPITSPVLLSPSSPDLRAALSTLKDLIRFSATTLDSLSTLSLYTTNDESDNVLCSCPFNFHHRVPPESLFLHSLRCSSSPGRGVNVEILSLESLRYPNTLQNSEELVKQNRFLQTLHDPTVELCFSLDEYLDFAPNFFYLDCPGAVTSTDQDSVSRTFTLPGTLSVECLNFVRSGTNDIKRFPVERLRFLPSELWFVRSEIEAWNDYPTNYSYRVLRAILCSSMAGESNFLRWVIVNSPNYGVVIDVSMRDHMVLLFRLCSKAIVREAIGLASLVVTTDVEELRPIAMDFRCPILFEVLTWLSCQFSVLYGKVKGKLFALNMLKQWILNSLRHFSLFPVVNAPNSPPLEDVNDNEGGGILDESINSKVIFVSQVAAAVASLHERSLLEEKIKAIRNGQQHSVYQRMVEHEHLTKRADEARQKRSSYRPLLEHDGLFWQQPRNQEINKTKTREELLAEERDYKRRRTSYRGKKLKRTPIQVMRDIIEEHMESIRQAGGIGSLVKDADQAGKFSFEPSLLHDISTDVVRHGKNECNLHENSSKQAFGYKKQPHSHNNVRSARFDGESVEDLKRRKGDSSWPRDRLEGENGLDRGRHDREYHSRSPNRKRSNDHFKDRVSNCRSNNDMEWSRKKFSQSPDFSKSRYHEQSNHRRGQVGRNSKTKERRQQHAYRDHESKSAMLHEFEDRYDPYESRDIHDNDVSFRE